jgi:hypothetical protein
MRDDAVRGDGDAIEADGAAGGGALAHAVPVVDDSEAGRVARYVGDMQQVALRPGEHRDPVGGQGAGGVVLDPGQDVRAVGGRLQPRTDVLDVLGAGLGPGVAEAPACQQLGEEGLALLRRALAAQHIDVGEMALRDLGEAGVTGREQPEDLGQGPGRDIGAASAASSTTTSMPLELGG